MLLGVSGRRTEYGPTKGSSDGRSGLDRDRPPHTAVRRVSEPSSGPNCADTVSEYLATAWKGHLRRAMQPIGRQPIHSSSNCLGTVRCSWAMRADCNPDANYSRSWCGLKQEPMGYVAMPDCQSKSTDNLPEIINRCCFLDLRAWHNIKSPTQGWVSRCGLFD
ncbi:uncharacterized protein LY79DRAFT_275350 [Colletotrichum navitas]|uniref:Uncharacterized protein n=1 Tax=Colletotrichum navitas TaxID=681940 RepID=A0AAD8PUU6_9PEZI|nr:uncharacterized protein LY79DRAFT_275350 [Colletotrichum navitas]KAK1585122.1 hypothetical protein LY79DRAFT_275350 [Colletotrichum navitas]